MTHAIDGGTNERVFLGMVDDAHVTRGEMPGPRRLGGERAPAALLDPPIPAAYGAPHLNPGYFKG